MAVGAGEHDGGHAANERKVNDEDAAERLLTEPLDPGEWPRPEPDEIEEKIDDLKDGDANQPSEQIVGLDRNFLGQVFFWRSLCRPARREKIHGSR